MGAGQESAPEAEAVGAGLESDRVLELVETVAAIRESRQGSLVLVVAGKESLRGPPQRVEVEIPQLAEGQRHHKVDMGTHTDRGNSKVVGSTQALSQHQLQLAADMPEQLSRRTTQARAPVKHTSRTAS